MLFSLADLGSGRVELLLGFVQPPFELPLVLPQGKPPTAKGQQLPAPLFPLAMQFFL